MNRKEKNRNWLKIGIISVIVALIIIGGIYLATTIGPAIAKAHGM